MTTAHTTTMYLAFGLALGCSAGASTAQSSTGPAGGTTGIANGTSVTVPAGALGTTTTITLAQVGDGAAPAGTSAVGATYQLGPEGQQFAVPVIVKLAFDVGRLTGGKTASDVVIYTAPVGSTSFSALATTVVDASHVQASTSHFSIFMPVVVNTEVDLGVPDQSVPDLAGADLAGADLAGADLASAFFDGGTCSHVQMGSSSTCTLNATCGGHTYQLSCPLNAGSMCYCIADGVTAPQSFIAGQTCLSTIGGDYSWTHYCMFP